MYALTSPPPFSRRLIAKIFSCGVLALAADFLFYDAHIGWTLGIFALGLLLAVLLHQPHVQKGKAGTLLSLAALGLTLSMIETPTFLAAGMYLLTVFGLVLLPRIHGSDARHALRIVMRYMLLTSFARIYTDSLFFAFFSKRLRKLHASPYGWVLHWALPVVCSLGFILLFSQANPLVMQVVERIDFRFPAVSLFRIALWAGVVTLGWALLRPRLARRVVCKAEKSTVRPPRFTLMGLLFNDRSIFTSLVLFNLLFLMQNAMDLLFIWSGAALPEGMSYAHYAHRGAYPLMLTALLAAFFILVAFKAETAPSARVRWLVYGWVAQNIFLVTSSIMRLLGYIAEYQLTYLRIAALIWMALVAAGLLLIVVRIHMQRSNRWLVNHNAAILYGMLYLCCFVNFGTVIAHYNLHPAHRQHAPDMYYLEQYVGIAAIPALLAYDEKPADRTAYESACRVRERLQVQIVAEDWRAWTFRRHRIASLTGPVCQPFVPAQPDEQSASPTPRSALGK